MEYINNRYEIYEKIDEGAMGIIYKARDHTQEEDLILKVINLDSSETPSLDNFKNEYNVLKQLRHPNIVRVYDFTEIWSVDNRFVPPKYYLISMEDISGKNLKEAKEEIADDKEWCSILKQAIEALNYIHFNGTLHNDIRTDNIYITDDKKRVKFLDFGISESLNEETSINNIKKASDWRNLFELFKTLLHNKKATKTKSFVNLALDNFDYQKGFTSRKVINLFNSEFKNFKISPAWIKYNPDLYITPKNSGLYEEFNEVFSFIDKDKIKEKILFIVGDEYSEALILYFRANDYFKYKNYRNIKIRSSNILDTLFSIISRLKQLDVENKFISEYKDITEKILNRNSSILDGNKKFVTYNKISQLLQSISQELKLVFDIPKYGMLNENQVEFFNFLLNSTSLTNISWLFYDTLRDEPFEKYINQTHYEIKFVEFDFVSLDKTNKIIQNSLLLSQNEVEKNQKLIKTIHEKSNGKFLSIIRFTHYLFQKNILEYKNQKYIYNLDEILNCKYSFSYEKELKNVLSSLTEEEKRVISLIIFINRNTNIKTIQNVLKTQNAKNTIDSLLDKNLIEVIDQDKNKLIKLKYLTFKYYCKKKLSLDEKFKKRAVYILIKSISKDSSLADIYFIIKKLDSLKSKKPFILIKYISFLMDKYIRDVYRKEIKNSVTILEKIYNKISGKYYHNLAKLKLAIFYYFNENHEKSLSYFKKVDIKYLKLKDQLDYYLNYSKTNIFENNVEDAKKLLIKGNILAKENDLNNYRYFFFNVKGMLYARLNKNILSESYFDILYEYILKNGFHQEIVNFASNYFLILYRVNKTEKAIKRGNKLLSSLNDNKYENKKATVYIFDQLARVYIKTKNYKKALDYREKAYQIAFNVQNIDEMIQMKENSIIPKYFLNFDKDVIINDLKKVIDLSIKYKREEQAINSYGNLILLFIETGNLSSALKYYQKAISFFNLKKLEYLKYFLVLRRGINIFSELGDKKNSISLFKEYYKQLRKLKENRFLIHKIEYLETKCMYYYSLQKYSKFLIWQKKYLDHYYYLESNNILSFSTERLLEIYFDTLEILHFQGKEKEKQKLWNEIEDKFGEISKLKQEEDSDINYSYYLALVEKNKEKKKKLLKEAVDHTIKHKNYINIEKIIHQYLKVLDSENFEYYNTLLILLISFKKFFENIPLGYKKSWLNKKTIQKTIKTLSNSLNISKDKIKSSSREKLVSKFKKSFIKKLNINTQKMVKEINKDLWENPPGQYIKKISNFLKDAFFATRIVIKVNDTIKINQKKEKLYSSNSKVNKELIENSYLNGDYIINHKYTFGDPVSTLVIPIINSYNKNLYEKDDKRSKSVSYHDYYFGYIYIESKYPLSNINEITIKLLKNYIEFISLYITHEKTHNELVLDNLTNLYTREHFLKLIKRKFSHAKKRENTSLFMLIDIDYFKQINDTFGHQKGDEVLEKISALLRKNIRKNDLIGRYGGEEFIIFMENIKIKEAKLKAKKIKNIVEEADVIPNRKITVSIGCAMYPKDSQWINILINQADIAMYNAKKTGRNKVVFWDEDLQIQKTKTNLLTGIITEDIMRSKHKIRNFIELLDYNDYNLDSLFNLFTRKIKYLIPHKYYYIKINIKNKKFSNSSDNIEINNKNFKDIPVNSSQIFINWKYFNTPEKILHNDLVYRINKDYITGVLIFSNPTDRKNYNMQEKNLLDKLIKLFTLKINSYLSSCDTDQHLQ